jgi:predicted phosphodiesterase
VSVPGASLRVAFFSDIHGNIRGLDACLADLAEQGGADVFVGVGDFCMDGPRPREVLERLREIGARCVRGNTDRYIAEFDRADEDDEESAALAWQCAHLGETWVRWLGDLPFSLRIGDGEDALLAVHANPKCDDIHIWPDADDAFLERMFAGVPEKTIVFGHLHLPYARVWRDRLLVNVASAGLPKDGDARAAYALLTQRSGGWEVKHRRVPFDVEKVVRDIERSKMPGARRHIKTLRRHRYKELAVRIP